MGIRQILLSIAICGIACLCHAQQPITVHQQKAIICTLQDYIIDDDGAPLIIDSSSNIQFLLLGDRLCINCIDKCADAAVQLHPQVPIKILALIEGYSAIDHVRYNLKHHSKKQLPPTYIFKKNVSRCLSLLPAFFHLPTPGLLVVTNLKSVQYYRLDQLMD